HRLAPLFHGLGDRDDRPRWTFGPSRARLFRGARRRHMRRGRRLTGLRGGLLTRLTGTAAARPALGTGGSTRSFRSGWNGRERHAPALLIDVDDPDVQRIADA